MADILACRLGGWRAARIVGVPYRTLDSWVRTELLQCEVPAQGKGTHRGFSFLDLIRARAVAQLRTQGVNVRTIRKAQEMLTERYGVSDPLADTARLVVAGERLMWALDDERLLDVIRQQVAARPLVILPVAEIVADTRTRVQALCNAA